MFFDDCQGIGSVAGFEHRVALDAKKLAGQFADSRLVFDHENCFRPARYSGRFCSARRAPLFRLIAANKSRIACLFRFAFHPDISVALFHDAVDGGEAESSALSHLFCGKKWLKNMRFCFFVMP